MSVQIENTGKGSKLKVCRTGIKLHKVSLSCLSLEEYRFRVECEILQPQCQLFLEMCWFLVCQLFWQMILVQGTLIQEFLLKNIKVVRWHSKVVMHV